MKDQVIYAASPEGYVVLVFQNYKETERYEAGNCPFDSQVYLSAGDPDAVAESTLLEYALLTSIEMAAERKIPRSHVYHDPAILP